MGICEYLLYVWVYTGVKTLYSPPAGKGMMTQKTKVEIERIGKEEGGKGGGKVEKGERGKKRKVN